MDKTANRGIYQYCKISYENIKDCCIDPMNCGEGYAQEVSETLRASSLNLLKSAGEGSSCQMSKLSGLISNLSGFQTEFCSLGVKNCKIECENKLEELRSYFRQCFSIPDRYSIEEILEKALAPPESEEVCYEQMKKLTKKYKSQSLDKKAKLREELKAKDIIKCEDIQKARTKQALSSLALNVCHEGERQKQAEEKRLALKQKREQERQRLEQKQAEQKRVEQKLLEYSRIEQARRAKQIQLERATKNPAPAKAPVPVVEKAEPKSKTPLAETKEPAPAKAPAPAVDKAETESQSAPAKSKEQALEKAKIPTTEKTKPKSKANPSKTKKQASARTKAKPSSSFSNPNKKQNPTKAQAKTQVEKAGKKAKEAKAVQKTTVHTKKKASLKAKKSRLKKTTPSAKKPSKKASLKGSLRENQLKSSSKNNLQTATIAANLGNCPVSMPQIQSAIVFQSVEAPQIEPMEQQAWFPYDDYDLVQGKPAGVLVHLNRGRMDRQREFAMDLFISGENKYRDKCFHEPMKGEMREEEEDFCFFTRNNLRKEGDFKFFPLPMSSEEFLTREVENLLIQVALYPINHSKNKSCFKKTFFRVNVIKTGWLKLGFAGIDGGRSCKGYLPVSYQTLDDFVTSNEVKSYIPSMFPISGSIAKTAGYIKGNCNATPKVEVPSVTVGLLNDVDTLEWKRRSEKYSKIFAIVPKDYFLFHRQLDKDGYPVAGLVISPKWTDQIWFFGWWRVSFLGGSWNVAFVADDQKHQGTVAHELAHTLGQGREFYEGGAKCQQFKGSPNAELCKFYKIPTVLDVFYKNGEQVWNFKRDMFSIVNNRKDIKTQWIDRETYQKVFLILSKIGAVISKRTYLYKESKSLNKIKKSPLNTKTAIFSGFYHKKTDDFVIPKLRIRKGVRDLLTPAEIKGQLIPVVTVQLKEEGNVLKEVKYPVPEMQIKTFYKDRSSKTAPFPFSHVMTAFKLPRDYKKRKLQFVVLNPKGKKIYSAFIPDQKEKDLKKGVQNVVWLDKAD